MLVERWQASRRECVIEVLFAGLAMDDKRLREWFICCNLRRWQHNATEAGRWRVERVTGVDLAKGTRR